MAEKILWNLNKITIELIEDSKVVGIEEYDIVAEFEELKQKLKEIQIEKLVVEHYDSISIYKALLQNFCVSRNVSKEELSSNEELWQEFLEYIWNFVEKSAEIGALLFRKVKNETEKLELLRFLDEVIKVVKRNSILTSIYEVARKLNMTIDDITEDIIDLILKHDYCSLITINNNKVTLGESSAGESIILLAGEVEELVHDSYPWMDYRISKPVLLAREQNYWIYEDGWRSKVEFIFVIPSS